ncbi:oxidoreductase [Colletotrichum plurivorum]|uniref:Oxidoreductase n=1 Tax=Colletotrichum plurivorum TaxID=2175906 RepID=A0A8H6N127_9PEZI|nr:oxidoreductase [Colletotrichum plurivorum]
MYTVEPPSLDCLARQISRAFNGNAIANDTFAVGGTIPIDTGPAPAEDSSEQKPVSTPVVLRWDATGDKETTPAPRRVAFSLATDADSASFAQLLQDMQPATFGLRGEHVLDEEYRKAIKLPATAFSVSFCPYELGIIDTVTHCLLPSIKTNEEERRSIRAELYNINVYSGPSGMFKAHVDTPRSKYQIGSLVVCFPLEHTGEQLTVKHAGKTNIFDWATHSNQPMIQWAVFYSDCEHEVHEVTSGHRVTITYNLYATKTAMCTSLSSLDPESLPLYSEICALVTDPRFKVKKRVLGFHSAFKYPHTSANHGLPFCLKGLDMAVYEIFRCMDLKIHLSAVVRGRDTAWRSRSDAATDGIWFSDNESSNESESADDQSDDDDDDSSLSNQTVVRPICAMSSLGVMDDDDNDDDSYHARH